MVQKALAFPGASGDAQPSVIYKFDGIGRKFEESTWGGARKTKFDDFDVFGRARNIVPDGTHATGLTFRGERIKGRVVQVATGIGTVQSVFTTEEHDHHGRLVAVCEAATAIWNGSGTCSGQLTRYSYDQDDRLIKVCQNANPSGICGQERLFAWDGRGFLVSEKHPEIGSAGGGTILYQRDARGNVTGRNVAVDTDDRPLRFTYDGAGRNIRVEEQLQNTSFRTLKEFFYARANIPGNPELRRGQLVMARRTNWVTGLTPLPESIEGGVPLTVTDHYQYAGLGGRVSKKTTSISLPSGGQSFTSEYTYGPLGDIASITYPSGDWPHQTAPSRTVTFERRLGYLTDVEGYASDITYQLGGMLYEIQYPNGVTWRQNHEAATGWERPDSIDTFAGSTLLWSTGDYNYDGAGNITEIGNRDYVYDAFSRFSYVRNNGVTPNEQVATYDAYGNLTSLARSGITRALTTNPLTNRLQIAGTTYTSNGEITRATIDGAKFEYNYDGLGQQLFQQSTSKTWLYVYDANDERVMTWECAQNLCGNETTFERYTPRGLGGEVLRTFEGRYRGSLEWKEDYVYRDGQPLAWIKAPTTEGGTEIHQYLHADHLGSTRLVTSATGTQVSRHDFLPFGEESTAVTGGDVDLKFTGHERDQPGKPHDYMHARFYSPNFGRFLRIDPAQASAKPTVPQSWNRYSYAANNPIANHDPDGRESRAAQMLEQDIQALAAGKISIETYRERIQARGEGALFAVTLLTPGPEELVLAGVMKSLGKALDTAAKFLRGSRGAKEVAANTRFINDVTVIDKKTGDVLQGTVDLKPTIDRVAAGTNFPHKNDGSVFGNKEGLLPKKPDGYYREYVHPTPGVSGPGPQRIVTGKGGEIFYTPDHYKTFIPVNP